METQSMDSPHSEERPAGGNRGSRPRSDTHPAVGIASLCAGVPLLLTMAMSTIKNGPELILKPLPLMIALASAMLISTGTALCWPRCNYHRRLFLTVGTAALLGAVASYSCVVAIGALSPSAWFRHIVFALWICVVVVPSATFAIVLARTALSLQRNRVSDTPEDFDTLQHR